MIPKVLLTVKLDPLLDRDEAALAMEPGPPATAPAIDLPPAGSLDRVVLGMCSHETHEPDLMRVVEPDDEPVPVPADVEYNPVVANDACFSVRHPVRGCSEA